MITTHKVKRFWKRQVITQPTTGQYVFDWVVGGILPILCLIFDPFVFRNQYVEFQVFSYVAIGLGVLTLACWLILGKRVGVFIGFVTGILLVGTLFSLVVGIVLFPISLLGLLICLGIFGFVPFLTSFVYFRNGIRAFYQATDRVNRSWLVSSMFLGTAFVIAIPFTVHWHTSKMIENSIQGIMVNHQETGDRAIQTYNYYKSIVPEFTYLHSSNQVEKSVRKIMDSDIDTANETAQQLHRLYRASDDWKRKYDGIMTQLITREVRTNQQPIDEITQKLKFMNWCIAGKISCYLGIARLYWVEKNEDQRKRLQVMYERLTGRDINTTSYMIEVDEDD